MHEPEKSVKLYRDYCFFLNSKKYNRNLGCKWHDNAYGINGGGSTVERKIADRALLNYMQQNKDPLAYPVYITVRLWGWLFFNYHKGLWKGQLIKRLCPHNHKQ